MKGWELESVSLGGWYWGGTKITFERAGLEWYMFGLWVVSFCFVRELPTPVMENFYAKSFKQETE